MSATTQRLLLDSALRLMSKQGYAQTSMQGIAEAAGLTKGALYHHFRSKEDILLRLHDEMIEHGIAESRDVLEAHLPPQEALCALIRAHVRMIETHRDAIVLFLRERRVFAAETRTEIKRQRDIIEDAFLSVVKDGQAAGDFRRDDSARLVVYGILGMINWTAEWFRPGVDDTGEIGTLFCSIVISGLTIEGSPIGGTPGGTANRPPS